MHPSVKPFVREGQLSTPAIKPPPPPQGRISVEMLGEVESILGELSLGIWDVNDQNSERTL